MKKISIFINMFILSISLIGCAPSAEYTNEGRISHHKTIQIGERTFIPLNDDLIDFAVYVDEKTRVVYTYSSKTCMFSVLIDADGKPMLYEGELE